MKKLKMMLFLIFLLSTPIIIHAEESSSNCYDLQVGLPEIGGHPSYIENDDYITVTNQYWKNITDDKIMESFDVFEENKKYEYSVDYNKKYNTNICKGSFNYSNNPYSLGGGSTADTTSGSAEWKFYLGDLNNLNAKTGDVIIESNINLFENGRLKNPTTINNAETIMWDPYMFWKDSNDNYLGAEPEAEIGKTYKLTAYLSPMHLFNSDFQVINNNRKNNYYQLISEKTIINNDGTSATYEAEYKIEPRKYNIIFDNNFDSTKVIQTMTYDIEENLMKNEFERSSYIFAGWNTNADGSGEWYEDSEKVKNITDKEEIVLYAQWIANSYTIEFNNNNGTGTMSNLSMTYDVEKDLTKNAFVKEGYEFTGWNTKADGTGTHYNDEQAVKNLTSTNNDTVTLFAEWQPISYTIKFNSNNGTGTMSDLDMVYDVGKSLTKNTFTREGYEFDGWNTKADGTGTHYNDKKNVKNLTSEMNGIVILYAEWIPNPYTISFNANPPTGSAVVGDMEDLQMIYDTPAELTTNNFAIIGYTFDGWNTKADGTGTKYENEEEVNNLVASGTVPLYAQWEQIKHTGFATNEKGETVYYNEQGQMLYGIQKINDSIYGFDPNTGAMFKGQKLVDGKWYYFDSETGKAKIGFVEIPAQGKTVYYNEQGQMLYGIQKINDSIYGFDPNTGAMLKGQKLVDGKWYYFDSETGKAKIGFVEIPAQGKTVYYNEQGQMLYGIQKINGIYYGFDPNTGALLKGQKKVYGYYYMFDENGVMQTGFQYIASQQKTVYYDETGKMVYGQKKIGDYYYLFDSETGAMQTGFQYIASQQKTVYYDENGHMLYGNQIIDGTNYYFNEQTGAMKSNFVYKNGYTYYYEEKKGMVTDWITIAGTKYFFNSLGHMIGKNVQKVIDVSSYQGDIDWVTVKNKGGVDGVIVRIAAGCEVEDSKLARNIAELKRLNIPYGIYIYSYAENYNEGVLYAQFTIDKIKKYGMNPTLGIYFDLESNVITKYMGTAEYTKVVQGYMDTMNKNGYGNLTKIYTYTNYANTALNTPSMRNLIDWIAQYYHYTTYTGNYRMWQYSSSEIIPGISGGVDVSVKFY